MKTIKIKSLVVLEDYLSLLPYVSVHVQRASGRGEFAKESAAEDLECYVISNARALLSNRQKRLPTGTTLRLAVTSVHRVLHGRDERGL